MMQKYLLATASNNLLLSQTNASVSLEHVLGDNTTAVDVRLLLLVIVVGAVAVVGLEVLNQGVDVLIFLLLLDLGLDRRGGSSGGAGTGLLVEVTGGDVGVQRGRRRC